MKPRNGDPKQPQPVVAFATPEAAQSITAALRQQYEQATTWAEGEAKNAAQAQSDIDGWTREAAEVRQRLADLEQWIEQRDLTRRQHLTHTQQGRDIAQGAADTLTVLGFPIQQVDGVKVHPLETPQGDQRAHAAAWNGTDPNLTGVQPDPLDRFNAAHAEIGQDGTR
ncbi:hypothetical protein [Streptosporangium sp. G12]